MIFILGLGRTHPLLGHPLMGSPSTIHQTFKNKRPPSLRRFKASGRAGGSGSRIPFGIAGGWGDWKQPPREGVRGEWLQWEWSRLLLLWLRPQGECEQDLSATTPLSAFLPPHSSSSIPPFRSSSSSQWWAAWHLLQVPRPLATKRASTILRTRNNSARISGSVSVR